MSEKLRRNVHNGGIESKKEEVGRKKRVVLFNAFKFCVHDIIKKKRRKEKEKGRKSENSRLWVEDTRDSIYRSQSNEPLGVLIT